MSAKVLHFTIGALLAMAALQLAQAQTRMRLDFERGEQIIDDEAGRGGRIVPTPRSDDGPSLPRLGVPTIQYEGGSASERSARVVDDPLQPGNRVLEFRIARPNVRAGDGVVRKSRVQMNLYDNVAVEEVYVSLKVYLDLGLRQLAQYPRRIDWLTVSEWWNDAAWLPRTHPFRISVDLAKRGGDAQPLHLGVRAEAMQAGRNDFRGAGLWHGAAGEHALPFGEWFLLEYYYREGDASEGRFAMALTARDGVRHVLLDLAQATRHPRAPVREGLRHFNPVKLYTSAELTDFLADRGVVMRVLFDDLDIEACRYRPEPASTCLERWLQRR